MKHTSLLLLASFLLYNAGAQTKVLPADKVIQTAVSKAQKEKKKIILIFHASWCGWCHKMDNSLNDPLVKKYFDDNFVIEHLTVEESKDKKDLENPGGDAIKTKYGGKEQGLPFWAVLDAKGELLFDSRMKSKGPDGKVTLQNIGCPASEEEVAAFIDILKKTTRLGKKELDIISARFSKNKAH